MITPINSRHVIDLLNWGINQFNINNIENNKNEVSWILCEILNCERIDLHCQFDKVINREKLQQFCSMVKRRINGEPFQHILGKAPFYGRDFHVNKNVMVPRPETEIIIDLLKKHKNVSKILDVGTGSGCLAITIALEKLAKNIFATDISSAAIKTAIKNISLYKINNIQLLIHDFLKQNFKTKFDVVISNPPYISKKDLYALRNNILKYEPEIALTDYKDGLSFYYHFAKEFDNLVNTGGVIILEFGGNNQKSIVEKIFKKSRLCTNFFKDLQGDWRIAEVYR